MSKLTDEFAKYLKVHNIHNFTKVGGGKVFVTYSPEMKGRMYRSAQYVISGIGITVDPDAAWYDYGNKTFTLFHYKGNKEKAQEAALEWATEKFHIKELVKAPYRETWVSKEVYDRAMDALKKAKVEDENGDME